MIGHICDVTPTRYPDYPSEPLVITDTIDPQMKPKGMFSLMFPDERQ